MTGAVRRLAWVLRETWAGVRTRKLRALLVVVATAVAVGLLSFTSIASAIASRRVEEQFDVVTANRIVVTRATPSEDLPAQATIERFENDALIRRADESVVASLPFVDAAGVYTTLQDVEIEGTGLAARPVRIGAVSPAGYPLVARTIAGAGIASTMDAAPVVVVSSDASEHLEFPYRWAENYLYVGGRPHAVVGVAEVDPPAGESWDVLIPYREHFGIDGLLAVAHGELGVAEIDAVTVAVAGHDPAGVRVDVPLAPYALRRQVLSELSANTGRLGVAVLAAAVASISAIGLATVLERRWEIGLRRALGAAGSDIAVQFMGEAAVLGLAGGLVGALAGIAGIASLVEVAAVGVAEGLLGTLFVGGLLGVGAGLVSAAVPTVIALRIEPVEALRSR